MRSLLKYSLPLIIIFFVSVSVFAQEKTGDTQTQPKTTDKDKKEQAKKIRVSFYFDGRSAELINFLNQLQAISNTRFKDKLEIILKDVSKSQAASKEINEILQKIFKGNIPKDLVADIVCWFEDTTYIIGSRNIAQHFQPIVLYKLYPDLVKAITAGKNESAAPGDGTMKSKHYQGTASIDGKPPRKQGGTTKVSSEDSEYRKMFESLKSVLIGVISAIIGFILGLIIFKIFHNCGTYRDDDD